MDKFKLDLNEPHQIYKNAAGKRLPGVTTVNGTLDKPALRGWYAEMERGGIKAHLLAGGTFDTLPLTQDGKPKWFADVKKDRAADIGTVTHWRCEAALKGLEPDRDSVPADLWEKSGPGFQRFVAWWADERLAVVHSELQMVSEAMQVGGTADIIARSPVRGLGLVDLKTSKASRYWPYDEVFAQVAAYAAMYEEVHGERIAWIDVVRIGKEEKDAGQVHRVTDAERAAGERLFRAALAAYNAKKELGR